MRTSLGLQLWGEEWDTALLLLLCGTAPLERLLWTSSRAVEQFRVWILTRPRARRGRWLSFASLLNVLICEKRLNGAAGTRKGATSTRRPEVRAQLLRNSYHSYCRFLLLPAVLVLCIVLLLLCDEAKETTEEPEPGLPLGVNECRALSSASVHPFFWSCV